MTWLSASELLAIDVDARHRVQELRASAPVGVASDADGHQRAGACWMGPLRTRVALVLALIGLVAVSCAGCATGTGSIADKPGISEGAASTPAGAAPLIPDCRGRGSYNRAANLCVSEGA